MQHRHLAQHQHGGNDSSKKAAAAAAATSINEISVMAAAWLTISISENIIGGSLSAGDASLSAGVAGGNQRHGIGRSRGNTAADYQQPAIETSK